MLGHRRIAAAGLALALLAPAAASASAELHGQGLLWRIDGLGAPPSHVFGTMHVSDERVLRLPEPVLTAFDASRVYLFELIVPDDGFVNLAESMLLPPGYALRDIVGERVYSLATAAAGRYGLSTRQVHRMHPGALAFILKLPAGEWRRRAAGWAFLDQALQNEARRLNRPLAPLETIEEQQAFLAGEGMFIADLLEAMIEHGQRMEYRFEVMLSSYLRGDIDAILDSERSHAARQPREAQAVLAAMDRHMQRRNRTMVERMQPYLRRGRAFVAVGAAHLPGNAGVLHLLEQRGYSVTRAY